MDTLPNTATAPRPWPSGLLRVAALVALVALAACTSGFVYNRLDTVARWYIGNLVTLDRGQQEAVRTWLGQTLDWHRASELRRYEEFLHSVAERVAAGPDAALYPEVAAQAERFMQGLLDQVAPDAAGLLATLDAGQVEELLANLDKRNLDELAEEASRTDEDRQRRRVRSMMRQLERWTGSATPAQRDIIDRHVGSMAAAGLLGEDAEWLASQQAWAGELRAAFEAGDATAVVQIAGLLREPRRSHTAAHLAAQEERRRRFLALAQEIDMTLTMEQRQRLVRRLHDLAADLRALQPAT